MKRFLSLFVAAMLVVTVFSGCNGGKKEYKILDESLADEEYGIGFRKADQALRDEVMRILVEMNNDGKFAEISNKWFGKNVSTLPTTFTPSGATDDSLQKIKDKGKLIMGLDVALPPMGFKDEDGNITGFDIDLAKEVCSRMGVTLEPLGIIWETKETELDTNKIDCIWNGYTINDERKEMVNMTEAYMGNRQVLVVMEDSPIKTAADLAGKKMTLQKGSTASDALDEHPDIKASLDGGAANKIDDNVTALLELSTGKCDVVLMDETVAQYYVSHKNEIKAQATEGAAS